MWKTKILQVTIGADRGLNEMILKFNENDKDVYCTYNFSHRQKGVKGLKKTLSEMITMLEEYEKDGE